MKKFISLLLSVIFALTGCAAAFALCNYALNYSQSKYEKEPPQELTELGSPNKVYFNQLSNIEKHAYNAILSEIYDFPESITIPQVTEDQLKRVNLALLNDNPDLFFLGRKPTLFSKLTGSVVMPEYYISKSAYEIQKKKLDKVCDKIISSLTNPGDEWQTELEIHDYIIDNCRYELVEGEYVYSSAYGALVNGEAACEGYSKATKLLLNKMGIECSVVSDDPDSQNGDNKPHMWNVVKINGDYYYLDCTWDDPVTPEKTDEKIYDYFNVTSELISKFHTNLIGGVECTATAENYYVKSGKYFETYDRTDEKRLSRLFADEFEKGNNSLSICFGSFEVYDRAYEDLFENQRISNILYLTNCNTDNKEIYLSEKTEIPSMNITFKDK
ncbi:MAG: transglutaminase domain-containing protein [Acutalibacteraceae bacterium]